jgi:hypothetical protein
MMSKCLVVHLLMFEKPEPNEETRKKVTEKKYYFRKKKRRIRHGQRQAVYVFPFCFLRDLGFGITSKSLTYE